MKIGKQKIEVTKDGKATDHIYLNRGYQRGYIYFEHDGVTAELAQGKTKQQAKAGELQRKVITLFNGAIDAIEELYELDDAAADAVSVEIYSNFTMAKDGRMSGCANLKSLEQRAAALHFACDDALSFVEDRAGMEYAQLLMNICYDIQNEYEHGRIKAEARTQEALRLFKETQGKAEKEPRRELSPEGLAIFNELEAAQKEIDRLFDKQIEAEDRGDNETADRIEQELDKITKEAEAPLNALALKNPEEATQIFDRSSFFDYECIDADIYLGRGVFCRRDELIKLDTPEKRAAYIDRVNNPSGDEDGAGGRFFKTR